jgi:hypothetical protein
MKLLSGDKTVDDPSQHQGACSEGMSLLTAFSNKLKNIYKIENGTESENILRILKIRI